MHKGSIVRSSKGLGDLMNFAIVTEKHGNGDKQALFMRFLSHFSWFQTQMCYKKMSHYEKMSRLRAIMIMLFHFHRDGHCQENSKMDQCQSILRAMMFITVSHRSC